VPFRRSFTSVGILGKALRVLPETQLFEPARNLLHRGPSPRSSLTALLHRTTGKSAVATHQPKSHAFMRRVQLAYRFCCAASGSRLACQQRLSTALQSLVFRVGGQRRSSLFRSRAANFCQTLSDQPSAWHRLELERRREASAAVIPAGKKRPKH